MLDASNALSAPSEPSLQSTYIPNTGVDGYQDEETPVVLPINPIGSQGLRLAEPAYRDRRLGVYLGCPSFNDLLCTEGSRILQFLSFRHTDSVLRCLSSGFKFRVSMARFASLPEESQQQILRDLDSEATSEATPDPGYLDDMYPGFEDSVSDRSGGEQSDPMPESGGELLRPRPNLGGDSQSSRFSLEEEEVVWDLDSQSPPSIRVLGKVSLRELEVERLSAEKMQRGQLDQLSVLEVVRLLWNTPDSVNAFRPFQASSASDSSEVGASGRWTAGAYVHGGVVGLTRTVRSYPATVAFLCEALHRRTKHSFAAITLLFNCRSEDHVDSHNDASSLNVAWNLSEGPEVGGLRVRTGNLLLPPNAWASFWPRVHHGSLPGSRNKILLVGYTPRNLEKLSSAEVAELQGLGFCLPPSVKAPVSEEHPLAPSNTVMEPFAPEEDEDLQLSIDCPADPDGVVPFLREMYVRIHALKVRLGRREVHLAEEGLSDNTSAPLLAWLHSWSEDLEAQLQGEANWRARHGDMEFRVFALFPILLRKKLALLLLGCFTLG